MSCLKSSLQTLAGGRRLFFFCTWDCGDVVIPTTKTRQTNQKTNNSLSGTHILLGAVYSLWATSRHSSSRKERSGPLKFCFFLFAYLFETPSCYGVQALRTVPTHLVSASWMLSLQELAPVPHLFHVQVWSSFGCLVFKNRPDCEGKSTPLG